MICSSLKQFELILIFKPACRVQLYMYLIFHVYYFLYCISCYQFTVCTLLIMIFMYEIMFQNKHHCSFTMWKFKGSVYWNSYLKMYALGKLVFHITKYWRELRASCLEAAALDLSLHISQRTTSAWLAASKCIGSCNIDLLKLIIWFIVTSQMALWSTHCWSDTCLWCGSN